MYWFLSAFSDSVYILHFLRYSLSLLAMQSRAFISAPNGYIFLLTATSATPLCPFAQHDDVRTDFWHQQTCQRQDKAALPFLHLIHLFSLRKPFHTDLCPSYLLFTHLPQWTLHGSLARVTSDMHMEVKLHQITGYISLSSFTLSLNQLLQSTYQNTMDQQVWPYCFLGWLSLLYSSPHLGQDAAPLWGFCCLSERPRQAQFCFKELLQSTQKMGNVIETFWKYAHPSRRNFIIIPPSPFFLNLWDAWDARHWYWRTQNH